MRQGTGCEEICHIPLSLPLSSTPSGPVGYKVFVRDVGNDLEKIMYDTSSRSYTNFILSFVIFLFFFRRAFPGMVLFYSARGGRLT